MFKRTGKKEKPEGRGKKFARRVIAVSAAAAVLAVLFALGSWFLPPVAVEQLAKLTNTRVKADSVSFSLNGSVAIKGLQIKPIEQTSYDNTVLRAGSVSIRFGLGSLFGLHPKLKNVSVRDFTVEIQEDLDSGGWTARLTTARYPRAG
jgi:hypothetical protein